MNNMSICINLEYLLLKKDNETSIINKLLECKRMNHDNFSVTFWHVNLTEQNCKDFVNRNEHFLFEINSHITRSPKNIWFLVASEYKMNNIHSRYTWDGNDILQGIDAYIKLSRNVYIREK